VSTLASEADSFNSMDIVIAKKKKKKKEKKEKKKTAR